MNIYFNLLIKKYLIYYTEIPYYRYTLKFYEIIKKKKSPTELFIMEYRKINIKFKILSHILVTISISANL